MVIRTRSRDTGWDVPLKIFANLDPELLERVRGEVRVARVLATRYLVHTYSLSVRGTFAWVVDEPILQQERTATSRSRHAPQISKEHDVVIRGKNR